MYDIQNVYCNIIIWEETFIIKHESHESNYDFFILYYNINCLFNLCLTNLKKVVIASTYKYVFMVVDFNVSTFHR